MKTLRKDVVVIGAGAAGLMCAIQAGQRGRSVLLIESSEKIGKKILISGGGRCNFTNRICSSKNYLSQNPHFCKSALSQYTPQNFISLVEKYKIPYHEKTLGQLFCDQTAKDIVELLEHEAEIAKVSIQLNTTVESIEALNEEKSFPDSDLLSDSNSKYKKTKSPQINFVIKTQSQHIECTSLVIATGGLSIPQMGASAFGYEIAKQFKHPIIPPSPALVPYTWNKSDLQIYRELSGISLPAIARFGSQSFRESILFTHRGLSGPAILQISSYCRPGELFSIDLLPDVDILDSLVVARNNGSALDATLSRYLPKRLAQKWCDTQIPAKAMSHRTTKDLQSISEKLHRWQIRPQSSEGFEKAEVTLGGVDTRSLSSKTMESQIVPNLYFIGEVVDVTGHLGGYNLQWAWSSGFVAGQSV